MVFFELYNITYFCRSFKCLVPASDNLAFPTLSIILPSDDNLIFFVLILFDIFQNYNFNIFFCHLFHILLLYFIPIIIISYIFYLFASFLFPISLSATSKNYYTFYYTFVSSQYAMFIEILHYYTFFPKNYLFFPIYNIIYIFFFSKKV